MTTSIATPIKSEIVSDHLKAGSAGDRENVSELERWLSLIGGGALMAYGLKHMDLPGIGLAVLGGALVHRGMTGHCAMYSSLGLSTKEHGHAAAVAAGHGVKIEHSITIHRSARELYAQWRQFENLPRFMSHLVSVTTDGRRSHWVAQAPAGMQVAWDAEIVTDEPGRLIGWRSLTGSQVATAGSVHFDELPYGHSTKVRVTLKYDPPGGQLGSWLAFVFGSDPRRQIEEDLRHFKEMMESESLASIG